MYVRARGRVVALAPKASSSGSMKRANNAMYTRPLTMVSDSALPRMCDAVSLSPAPSTMDMRLQDPTPMSTPMAVARFISGKVTVRPAMASAPTHWPMKMRSTTL